MHKTIRVLVAAVLIAGTAPAAVAKEPVPKKVGDCVTTSVKVVATRLEGVADSGSDLAYTNGLYQVSYETVPGIVASRPGDRVRICLTKLPQDCPPGDSRGKIYKATNLRTNKSWEAPDSEHSCGGA